MQSSPRFEALEAALGGESDAGLCELDAARLRVQIYAGGRGAA